MLPRILSAQFGLLDDGRMLQTSMQLLSGREGFWDVSLGRYRPVYWLYWAGNYAIFGPHPAGYFLLQAGVVLADIILLMLLIRKLGGSWGQASIAGTLVAGSGAVIENSFTLSKAEPLQLLFVQLSLLITLGSRVETANRILTRRIIVAAGFVLLGSLTKETTLIMLPIALSWLSISTLVQWQRAKHVRVNPVLLGYGVAVVLSSAVYLLVRAAADTPGIQSAAYLSRFEFSLSRLGYTGIRYLAWLLHDFAYAFPLLVALVLTGRHLSEAHRRQAAATVPWIGLWIAIYLPWLFVQDYYLMPAALAVATLTSSALVSPHRTSIHGWVHRGVRKLMLVGALPLGLAAALNSYSMAATQLVVDRQNALMARFLASEAPRGARVGVVLRSYSEYVPQLEQLLSAQWGRSDLTVEQFASGASLDEHPAVIVIPLLQNQRRLSPRMGFHEREVQFLDENLLAYFSESGSPIYSASKEIGLLTVDFARAPCSLLLESEAGDTAPGNGLFGALSDFCLDGRFVDASSLEYGWLVYSTAGESETLEVPSGGS